jgi:cysteinyl-tRNA synthetase
LLDLSESAIEAPDRPAHRSQEDPQLRTEAIRNDLAAKGILLDDSKDGVRWKRK